MNIIRNSTVYFDTYEQREEAFGERVGLLIPRKILGPAIFREDFSRVWRRDLAKFSQGASAYVTSDPRDCLAFGTPGQVLRAAGIGAGHGRSPRSPSAREAAGLFDLTANLDQPIRTLSGGETLKLALAKAYLGAGRSRQLVVASPFSWLSPNNLVHLERLVARYQDMKRQTALFALRGEDSVQPLAGALAAALSKAGSIPFVLRLEDAVLRLGASLAEFGSRPTTASFSDRKLNLASPCLVAGDNGQGKSLLAKTLCGALPFSGSVEAINENQGRGPRLLFQDVMTQVLSRPLAALADLARGDARLDPATIFGDLARNCQHLGQRFAAPAADIDYDFNFSLAPGPDSDSGRGQPCQMRSVLAVKMMLVAVRLSTLPAAMILDEPDWGLSRRAAIALVGGVIQTAHDLGVALILISHKPWWWPIAASRVVVSKFWTGTDSGKGRTFQIRVDRS